MTEPGRLLLYGVFCTLVEHGIPLGVSDYLDAVRALDIQVAGGRPDAVHRDGLRRLCRILWTRTAEEMRLVDRIFDGIAPPSPEDVGEIERLLTRGVPLVPVPDQPAETQPVPGGGTPSPQGESPDAAPLSARVSFQSVGEPGAVPLPYPVVPGYSDDTFVMQPQTVVTSRMLAVLWRRYRRIVRSGPRLELDLEATVAERCRQGIVAAPVLRPPRVNRARLLILADASPSMVPWRPFLDVLSQSLGMSGLQAARVLYFTNVPRRVVFSSAALTGPQPTAHLLERFAGGALLIVSDGGAARGFLNRSRAGTTRAFLDAAKKQMRAVVWINPMPRARWAGTTAGAVAASGAGTFLPLQVPALIRAIDILRGARVA